VAEARETAGQRRAGFLFLANAACLDFVNTEKMASGERIDLLAGFGDLIDWLRAAELIGDADARAARERWDGTAGARQALDRARALRAELRATAERASAGRSIGRRSLAAINAVLERPVHATQVVQRPGSGFERVDRWAFAAPADLLVPVAESARDLLCDGDLGLVRKCRNPHCILFFYDTTKNRGRTWCSMSLCGNREKVASHYRRVRAERSR
jgi:predicted RNA-binding Zn ribbon-like protein